MCTENKRCTNCSNPSTNINKTGTQRTCWDCGHRFTPKNKKNNIVEKKQISQTLIVKAIEEINENLAVEVISNENIDGQELSQILTDSFMGDIIDKDTKKTIKLSNKVLMVGILNRMNQLDKENNK